MYIDYDAYNPATDPKIYVNYDAETFRKKKAMNKASQKMNLPILFLNMKPVIRMMLSLLPIPVQINHM